MKIKKILTVFLLIFSILLLNSCGKDDEISYREEKIPFTNLTPSYYNIKSQYLNTYYIDNSEIKYVDVSEFFNTLDGFYMSSYFKRSVARTQKKYTIYIYANTGAKLEYLGVTFDWANDTIYVSNPMVFNVTYSPSSVDYMAHIEETGGSYGNITPLTISLRDYNFNIYYKDRKCFVPLSIMNTIFCSSGYYNIYYNGEKYLATFYDISAFDDASLNTIKTNKLNEASQTQELREETYNQMKFVLDYFYGLKEFKNISNFDEILSGYKDDILSLDPEKNRNAYYKFFINYLDDLHTRIGAYSFYNAPGIKPDNWDLSKTSQKRIEYHEVEEKLKDKAEIVYPNLEATYKISGETAILYMPSFLTGSDDDLKKDNSYLYDSYEYMKWALGNIQNKNIKNIVLDLSINGGGNVAALLKVLGFMSNDNIEYIDYNYLFKSKMTSYIKIDTNGDNDFSDDDAYTNYNWYVLSSLNTFSAANSCLALAKSLGAKVIGQKSGGGMCSVMPVVLADSTTIEISSNMAQMAKIDGEYRFIEAGIEPDIVIDYDNFYDFNYLDNLLKN